MAAPKPTEYRDEALVLPLPGKPWVGRTDSKHKQAKLVLVFGKGYLKPELRLLAVDRPIDEPSWCQERWRDMQLERWNYVRGETRTDAERDLSARWEKPGRQIAGPEAAEFGGVPARLYVSQGKGFPTDAGWVMLDLPGGFRVVELDVVTGTWDPFHREAKNLLAALAAV